MPKRIFCCCLWLGLTLGLMGCTKVNSGVVGMFKLETNVNLTFHLANNINPDERRQPSPVYIRVYELRSDQAFMRADFLELYERDETVLGKDLIARRELNAMVPGSTREEKLVVSPEARFIGLFAEFYEYRNSRFRLVVPVTAHNVVANSARIDISENTMVLGGR